MGISASMRADESEKGKTYHAHMVSVLPSKRSNYEIRCSCGHVGYVASVSDVFAAVVALDHVKEMQQKPREYEPCPDCGHPRIVGDAADAELHTWHVARA